MRVIDNNRFVAVCAENENVLCDGRTKTSVNGRVTMPAGTDVSEWVEMTEAEADALIEVNRVDEEMTDEEFTNMVEEVL